MQDSRFIHVLYPGLVSRFEVNSDGIRAGVLVRVIGLPAAENSQFQVFFWFRQVGGTLRVIINSYVTIYRKFSTR